MKYPLWLNRCLTRVTTISTFLCVVAGVACLFLCNCAERNSEHTENSTLDLWKLRRVMLRTDSTAGLFMMDRDLLYLNVENQGLKIYLSDNYINTITAINRYNQHVGVSVTVDSSLITRFIELPLDSALAVTLYSENGKWYVIDSLLALHNYDFKYLHQY